MLVDISPKQGIKRLSDGLTLASGLENHLNRWLTEHFSRSYEGMRLALVTFFRVQCISHAVFWRAFFKLIVENAGLEPVTDR
jgi:hypothetical protein